MRWLEVKADEGAEAVYGVLGLASRLGCGADATASASFISPSAMLQSSSPKSVKPNVPRLFGARWSAAPTPPQYPERKK